MIDTQKTYLLQQYFESMLCIFILVTSIPNLSKTGPNVNKSLLISKIKVILFQNNDII
jgi:hypothetical protein